MDVNGTRFHLLHGRADWAPLVPTPTVSDSGDGVAWNDERSALTLRPLHYRFPNPDALGQEDRRGVAIDGFGHGYRISEDERSIEIVPATGPPPTRFWPPLPEDSHCTPEKPTSAFSVLHDEVEEPPARLRGLALTTNHYLVAGVPEPPGLLVFDLHAGGPPALLPWPGDGPFNPFDFAPRADGGIWILDCEPSDETVADRYWALDSYLRLESRPGDGASPTFVPTDFKPSDSDDDPMVCARSQPIVPSMGWPLDGRPVAVEGLPDGSTLVLNVDAVTGATSVARYAFGERLGEADLSTPLLAQLEPGADEAPPTWTGHDMAFIAETPERAGQLRGILFVVGADGNQAFAFTLIADEDGLTATLREPYYPLRLFAGRGFVGAGGQVFYDLPDRWLPVVAQPKPRYASEGTVETPVFDGREPGCVWHRLLLDACIPAGTRVRVESRAADDEDVLAASPWFGEPEPYLRARGAELPAYRPFTQEERGHDGVGTWELLVQTAVGRFAQFRLVLAGSGRSTPRVYVLRAHFPRFSYVREYLPAVYQEDSGSASFLDRYLANAEGFLTEIEGRIAEVQTFFDERTLDPDYFEWLAGWFGTVLDPSFGDERRRLFLRHAVALYAQRGTHSGLIRMLRLALDPCPDDSLFEPDAVACDIGALNRCSTPSVGRFSIRVIERFITRGVSPVALGDPTVASGPRLTDPNEAWTPEQGAAQLHALFRDYLQRRYPSAEVLREAWGLSETAPIDAIRFSPQPPADDGQYEAWQGFIATELTFTYAEVRSDDDVVYRAFLERRYRRVEVVNARYGTSYGAFSAVPLPSAFPSSEPHLTDWIQFVSLVLPLDREAARFDVLVPIEPTMDQVTQAQQLDLVRRLVEHDKPAHTEFEVKPFWALFRVGDARLGLDTLLDRGSRFVALQLGQGALAASDLARAHPWNVPDRFVTGRDRPGAIL